MNIRPQKWENIYRKTSYSIITGTEEKKEILKEKREAKEKLKKQNDQILSAFKMFYGGQFSVPEWEEVMKKFTCPREAKGVIDRLAKELEIKGIGAEKWLQLAKKMFL